MSKVLAQGNCFNKYLLNEWINKLLLILQMRKLWSGRFARLSSQESMISDYKSYTLFHWWQCHFLVPIEEIGSRDGSEKQGTLPKSHRRWLAAINCKHGCLSLNGSRYNVRQSCCAHLSSRGVFLNQGTVISDGDLNGEDGSQLAGQLGAFQRGWRR